MHFILLSILLMIYLYENYFFKKIIEGNQSSNDCSKQQENKALNQQNDIDNLNGKLQRFELLLKQQKDKLAWGGFYNWANESSLKKTQEELKKATEEAKKSGEETS